MATQHAMLVLATSASDQVHIPEAEPLVVAAGAGEQAARDWWAEHLAAESSQQLRLEHADWQQGLSKWDTSTGLEFRRDRLQPGGPRVDVVRLDFPDGTQSVVPLDVAEAHLSGAFSARFPPPSIESHYARWRSGVRITERRAWTATLYLAGEARELPLDQPGSGSGVPDAQIPGCLDRLTADGWQVAHVSQDTETGPPPRCQSRATAIRFLLVRDADQQGGAGDPA
jgi:hypothetical protein